MHEERFPRPMTRPVFFRILAGAEARLKAEAEEARRYAWSLWGIAAMRDTRRAYLATWSFWLREARAVASRRAELEAEAC